MSKVKSQKLEWIEAFDIKKELKDLIKTLNLSHIDQTRIFCYRTQGSKSRSYARVWSFPKIFQEALEIKPAYVIEVLAKHYDSLSSDDKKRVLIHELLHIPRNFSGALLPHRSHGRRLENQVKVLFKEYKLKKNS
jgi:predicted metallopeptidase